LAIPAAADIAVTELNEPASSEVPCALRRLLRTGLPVTPSNAEPALLGLRGVRARAIDPDDEAACVDALDRVLRRLLKKLPGEPRRRAAAEALFGVRGTAGQTLTARRGEAARLLDYDPDHFRKRIEPRILADLAWLLEQDALQYRPRGRKSPLSEASGDTPVIDGDDLTDPERAEHEVLLSRIWSDVYGLRAELIDRERFRGVRGAEARFEEAAGGALWYLARLLTQLDRYLERYGERILHGEAEFNAEGLIRLAGWTGEVTEEQARELRYRLKRVGEWERREFALPVTDELDS
jgi:hypothetical protein